MPAAIRLARQTDAAAIAAIYGPAVASTAISFETEPPDAAEIGLRISRTLSQHPWLVCEIGPQVAGYAYASRHRERAAYRWSVDVAVYVDEGCRRLGVGRGLYASLLATLRAQGYVNAYAGITLPNPGSVGLHEAVGFTPLGVYERVGYKLGSWHDVGWWELALNTREVDPPEPISLEALVGHPRWPSLVNAGLRHIRTDAAC